MKGLVLAVADEMMIDEESRRCCVHDKMNDQKETFHSTFFVVRQLIKE